MVAESADKRNKLGDSNQYVRPPIGPNDSIDINMNRFGISENLPFCYRAIQGHKERIGHHNSLKNLNSSTFPDALSWLLRNSPRPHHLFTLEDNATLLYVWMLLITFKRAHIDPITDNAMSSHYVK